MRPSALFAAACCAAVALPAAAQSPRETVLTELDATTTAANAGGYVPDARALGRASVLGALPRDGSVRLEVNLRAGRRYRIVAACGPGCEDLDLRAYAADGDQVLAEDVEADARPVVSFLAESTGPYLISVNMAGCRTDFCSFGVRVLSR